MSYYTYFYPKKGLYNERNLSKKELERELYNRKRDITETKTFFRGQMVTAYYDNNTQRAYHQLIAEWRYLVALLKQYEKLNWALHVVEEDNEVAINHANCDSIYQLQDDIDIAEEYNNKIFSNLFVLTRIQSKSSQSSEQQTEAEYLRFDYQGAIHEYFDAVEDNVSEMMQKQFMLDCWEGHKTEDELGEESIDKEPIEETTKNT